MNGRQLFSVCLLDSVWLTWDEFHMLQRFFQIWEGKRTSGQLVFSTFLVSFILLLGAYFIPHRAWCALFCLLAWGLLWLYLSARIALQSAQRQVQCAEQQIIDIANVLPLVVFQMRTSAQGVHRYNIIHERVIDVIGVSAADLRDNPEHRWRNADPQDKSFLIMSLAQPPCSNHLKGLR
ncbi:hypothetical protein R6242_20695 [Iodobacter sp. CM08]|uniref:hypothetical protein n=1 Tax=Iodobacter sp. CM08 TaxID=3085902 RepID=UPI0029829FF5|nr:hypothetical protein [Iodobacter sp. CM08]MDW5418995.1 hypothetical protein [Iodobacter sp. CM08]